MRIQLIALTAMLALPLMGQAPAPAPAPETLALAKQLVVLTGGDKDATISGMAQPMVGVMQQMGLSDPAKAKQMVDEGILPLLREHYDELLSAQASSYAQLLTADDLKATIAFYNTKAGQDMVKAQPALAQARLTSLSQWVGAMQPEIQKRVAAIAKQHGWDKG